jgi:hypothetical protein
VKTIAPENTWSRPAGPDPTVHTDRYLQFLRQQTMINQGIAAAWATALTAIARAVLAQTRPVGHLLVEQAARATQAVQDVRDAEAAHPGEHITGDLADHLPPARKDGSRRNTSTRRLPWEPISALHQDTKDGQHPPEQPAKNGHHLVPTADLFLEVIDIFVGADITASLRADGSVVGL